jgi:hypothetical protein
MTRLQYTSSIIEALESEWLGKTESDVSTHTGPSISGPKVGLRQLPGRKEKIVLFAVENMVRRGLGPELCA